jgi:hypothetical protein
MDGNNPYRKRNEDVRETGNFLFESRQQKKTKDNVTCTPIAGQRVGKQVPAKTDLGKQSVAR